MQSIQQKKTANQNHNNCNNNCQLIMATSGGCFLHFFFVFSVGTEAKRRNLIGSLHLQRQRKESLLGQAKEPNQEPCPIGPKAKY